MVKAIASCIILCSLRASHLVVSSVVVCSPLTNSHSNSYMATTDLEGSPATTTGVAGGRLSKSVMTIETSGSLMYCSLNKTHVLKANTVLSFTVRQQRSCKDDCR